MSDKTKITQESLDSLTPAIRDIIKEENNLGDAADLIIDPILASLLPHIFEVVEEGGEEVSVEDVRQKIQEFVQQSERPEDPEEPAEPEERSVPVVSLSVASVNEAKGIAHVTVKLETEPLEENLFVKVQASGGSDDEVFRRINAGRVESHPITVPTGRNITLSIVPFNEIGEIPAEIGKKIKAPKVLPPYAIINQEESEESADE